MPPIQSIRSNHQLLVLNMLPKRLIHWSLKGCSFLSKCNIKTQTVSICNPYTKFYLPSDRWKWLSSTKSAINNKKLPFVEFKQNNVWLTTETPIINFVKEGERFVYNQPKKMPLKKVPEWTSTFQLVSEFLHSTAKPLKALKI